MPQLESEETGVILERETPQRSSQEEQPVAIAEVQTHIAPEKVSSSPVTVDSVAITPPTSNDEEREFDADDSDYIPEDENFNGMVELPVEEQEPGESTQSHAERLQEAISKLSPEIKTTLDEQLRGQFIQLRKIPRSRWI